MVALPEVKNVADCNTEGGSSSFVPEGNYQAIIVKSEMTATKNGTGSYLALTLVLTHGQHEGVEFIERLNLVNKNPKAVEIAYDTLAKISKALGMVKTPSDSSELHNKPLMVGIKNKKGDDWTNNDGEVVEGKEQSEIKKYLAVPAGGVPVVQAQTTETPASTTPSAPANNPFAA